jgi:hypothetical protein
LLSNRELSVEMAADRDGWREGCASVRPARPGMQTRAASRQLFCIFFVVGTCQTCVHTDRPHWIGLETHGETWHETVMMNYDEWMPEETSTLPFMLSKIYFWITVFSHMWLTHMWLTRDMSDVCLMVFILYI